jgi:hypothetical protein
VSEPTKFFRQHHAVDSPAIDENAFRPYWRVRSRLDQLLLDGAISFPVWRAGAAFRVLAEMVIAELYPAKWLDQTAKNQLGFGLSLAGRIDALDRLQRVRAALGGFAFELLERHLVDDQSWARLAQRYGAHPKTVRNWTITALQALATVIWEVKK